MSRLRVINLGLPKSGTTTLGKALRLSGLAVADWKIRKNQADDPKIARQFLGDLIYRGYFEHGDPLYGLDKFDAFTEISSARPGFSRWPQTDWGLLSVLIQCHPGVKFLLSRRDPADQAESMLRWTDLGRKRLPHMVVPGLPSGRGKTAGELIRWIDGHTRFCRRVLADSGRFLEYQANDPAAPAKIGDFLGLRIAWWGVENANPGLLSRSLMQGK